MALPAFNLYLVGIKLNLRDVDAWRCAAVRPVVDHGVVVVQAQDSPAAPAAPAGGAPGSLGAAAAAATGLDALAAALACLTAQAQAAQHNVPTSMWVSHKRIIPPPPGPPMHTLAHAHT